MIIYNIDTIDFIFEDIDEEYLVFFNTFFSKKTYAKGEEQVIIRKVQGLDMPQDSKITYGINSIFAEKERECIIYISSYEHDIALKNEINFSKVEIEWTRSCDKKRINNYLKNIVLYYITKNNEKNGWIKLHASCVYNKNLNKALIFMGNSGSGKSTVSAELCKFDQMFFVSDDVIFLSFLGNECICKSTGFPPLQYTRPNQYISFEDDKKVEKYVDKEWNKTVSGSYKVGGVFLLSLYNSKDIVIRRIETFQDAVKCFNSNVLIEQNNMQNKLLICNLINYLLEKNIIYDLKLSINSRNFFKINDFIGL